VHAVACIHACMQLWRATRRRITSALPRAVPRFPRLLLICVPLSPRAAPSFETSPHDPTAEENGDG
jgi:hypothetical protein